MKLLPLLLTLCAFPATSRPATLALPAAQVSALDIAAVFQVTDEGLARAQKLLEQGIARRVRLDAKRQELVLDATKPAPVVSPPFTLDIEWGSGHGGSLTLARFRVEADVTSVEEVQYRRGSRSTPRGWTARRVTRPNGEIRPLVDLVRALARTRVSTRRKPDAPPGASASSSSNDFFVLARLLLPDAPKIEREFCGYAGSTESLQYAGIQVVVDAARETLSQLPDWVELPEEELRKTHFTGAFTENQELMLKEFHWWVLERSVEALGIFGDRAALDTLRQLDERYQGPVPRQRNKIQSILARPEHFLSGPPKEVSES